MDLQEFIINAQRHLTEYNHLLPKDLMDNIKDEISELENAIKASDDKLMNKKLSILRKLTTRMQKIIRESNK